MPNVQMNKRFADEFLVVYPLDSALDWISANLDPSDVFDKKKLIEWAYDNGFRPEDENA